MMQKNQIIFVRAFKKCKEHLSTVKKLLWNGNAKGSSWNHRCYKEPLFLRVHSPLCHSKPVFSGELAIGSTGSFLGGPLYNVRRCSDLLPAQIVLSPIKKIGSTNQ